MEGEAAAILAFALTDNYWQFYKTESQLCRDKTQAIAPWRECPDGSKIQCHLQLMLKTTLYTENFNW